MSDNASLKQLGGGWDLNVLINRAGTLTSYLNRNVYRIYQNYQMKRWMTQNADMGVWDKLDRDYEQKKTTLYAGYPGGGTKMLIAKGDLFAGVSGKRFGDTQVADGESSSSIRTHHKVTTPRSIEISTSVEYAPYVNEKRNFTEYPQEFWDEISEDLKSFIWDGG